MEIRSLRFYNFRNLHEVSLNLSPGFNVLTGRNGQGKTNVLEGLYLLALPRSFRPGRIQEWIRSGQTQASVQCSVVCRGAEHELAMFFEDGRRWFQLDGKRVDGVAALSEHLKIIFFGPDDLSLVKGGPGERRRYMDRGIYRHGAGYLDRVSDYLEMIRQRNSMLRDLGMGKLPSGLIEAYEERMIELGARITLTRSRFVAELRREVETYWTRLEPITRGRLHLEYKSGYGEAELPDSLPEMMELAGQALERSRSQDIRRQATGVGPHLDELEISLRGEPARTMASQGQIRSIVAALRLGELLHWKSRNQDPAILMMDDLSSELDPAHFRAIMAAVEEHAGQVILTTTAAEYMLNDHIAAVFLVDDGQIRSDSSGG